MCTPSVRGDRWENKAVKCVQPVGYWNSCVYTFSQKGSSEETRLQWVTGTASAYTLGQRDHLREQGCQWVTGTACVYTSAFSEGDWVFMCFPNIHVGLNNDEPTECIRCSWIQTVHVCHAVFSRARDHYHTCYCLSGLSVAQHFLGGLLSNDIVIGNPQNRLVSFGGCWVCLDWVLSPLSSSVVIFSGLKNCCWHATKSELPQKWCNVLETELL